MTVRDPSSMCAHRNTLLGTGLRAGQMAVFVDFDGTIADCNGDIAPSTIDAIRTARANGHLIFLSTGRSRAEIAPEVYDIGFDGYITAAGGFAHLDDELVFSQTMSQHSVERILHAYSDAEAEYCLQYVDSVYVSTGLLDLFAASGRGGAASLIPHRIQTALAFDGVAKSVFASHNPDTYDWIQTALGDEFTVITGTLPHLGTGSGEVSLPQTHKAAAIPTLLSATGIPLQSTLAIGDSVNDIDMLRYCHIGIAMDDAPVNVRQAADETTTAGSEGIWNALWRHNLLTNTIDRCSTAGLSTN